MHCHIIDRKTLAVTDPKQVLATEITQSGISEFENVLCRCHEASAPRMAFRFVVGSVRAEVGPGRGTEILEPAFLLVRNQIYSFSFRKQI